MTAAPADSYPTPARGYYVTGVLLLAYTLSYVDRQILSLMVEPVKRDLMLSDTQISLLHGFAFAVFYTLVGLSRHADHHARAWKPYQQLEYVPESPKLPYGYFGTVVLVLFADHLFRAHATAELRRRGLGPFAPAGAEPAAVA